MVKKYYYIVRNINTGKYHRKATIGKKPSVWKGFRTVEGPFDTKVECSFVLKTYKKKLKA